MSQHSDLTKPETQVEHRIPARNLPEGVGPAWFDPDMLRLLAEKFKASRLAPTIVMELKCWVVLTLLDAYAERDALREAAQAVVNEWDALPSPPSNAEMDGLREALETRDA